MFLVIFAVRLIRAIVGLYVVTIAGVVPLLLMYAPSLPLTSPFLVVASLFVPLGLCVAVFLGLGALVNRFHIMDRGVRHPTIGRSKWAL